MNLRTITQPLALLALLAFVVVATWQQNIEWAENRPYPNPIRDMIMSGECWTGEAPEDVTAPRHVWIDGQYHGARAVHKALEQIFDGRDHGLVKIQAFCR